MIYIIMCGGVYGKGTPRHLLKIDGETIVARTIRLLRECGVLSIFVSISRTTYENYGDDFLTLDAKLLVADSNKFGEGGKWLDGFVFPPNSRPTTYIFGDVIFSPEAIKTIVKTKTSDIEFFASAPPYSPKYTKTWAEPFAFKVWNVKRFKECIEQTKKYDAENRFHRQAISWELWQVIKGTKLDEIDYTNYIAINDYSCDVDHPDDLEKIRGQM